ncbi:MAG TPA: RDD family protein, partial [Verrucomicrobiae bacterium]|nr:RDD family protein [Verrucomicrobiae bacterium]
LRHKVAGLGSRATAHLLDWLIIGLVSLGLPIGLGLLAGFLPDTLSDIVIIYSDVLMVIVVFLLMGGYFLLFEYFASGRTPGKMLTGIRVVQDNGQSLTFLSSAVRNLIRLIDFLPILYLIGILMIFFHSKHKRLGDLAAGTMVIYQRRPVKKKKKNPLDQEIERRLALNPVQFNLDEWTINKLGLREWKLLETYILRRPSLAWNEEKDMTMQVAAILYPILGMELANEQFNNVQHTLFALYLLLKDEWEYGV